MELDPSKIIGFVRAVGSSAIRASIPRASVGDLCWMIGRDGLRVPALITSFVDKTFTLAPLGTTGGLYPGALVETWGEMPAVGVGPSLLGRVVNALGTPIDGHGACAAGGRRSLTSNPPSPNERPLICRSLETGVGAIDGFLTLGIGQRMGIFASAGVGKSTLLGTIASASSADVIVVALVGERGREVGEFVARLVRDRAIERSVLVVATSDESSVMRQMAPSTAAAIAEYFRDQGKDVLLIVDSLTRFARALRETGLAAGELPVRHGYPSSVYTALPRLVERAGTAAAGTITALYTVLTNEHGDIDPLADEVKSLIDGHIVLSPELHALGILPAIDIPASVSRMFERLHDDAYRLAARRVRRALTRLLKERDILMLGGTPDAEMKRILEREDELLNLIRQPNTVKRPLDETREAVQRLAEKLRQ